MQLLYQLAVSAIVLLSVAPFFGELVRELNSTIIFLFSIQVLFVVCVGFLTWFWVLSIYPASNMASFSFLAPVFGVIFGWLILNETLEKTILISLLLVSIGVILVNRGSLR
ncbi:MAG: EamA family transporter [Gammaproteobacteria bacterium]|nr:EamA family transporter [Gammaproteobacteria bacterium]